MPGRRLHERGLATGLTMLVVGMALAAEEPRMLPREIHSETVLVKDGTARAVIAAPKDGPWSDAAEHVQDAILELTGARLPILSPGKLCLKDGLMLKEEYKRKAVIFVGNLSVNPALFEPYVRRWFVVDGQDYTGIKKDDYAMFRVPRSGWTVQTFPNPWGTGVGYAIVGGSQDADAGKATEAFAELCKKHIKGQSIVLPRLCEPGANLFVGRIGQRFWRRLTGPAGQELFPGLKQARSMHLGYYSTWILHEFTLMTDLGVFNSQEINDIEQEVLESVLAIPEKVWWYKGGSKEIGSRHPLFKNPRLYLAIEHLLNVGRPNDEARKKLLVMASAIREYLHYTVTKAYCPDQDPCTEADQAWMSAMWFALVMGDWEYFSSGSARDAAFYALLETDNMGGEAGHFMYEGLNNLFAASEVRNVLRLAAWWHKDGRFKWLLNNMPFTKACNWAFPIMVPMAGVESVRPDEWLGVQWLPLSEHAYERSMSSGQWRPPEIPRDRTAEILTFRSGFSEQDQYLAIDGFQCQHQPRGLCSATRYVDQGKLFLTAHTCKEGNYFKSGVVANPGARRAARPTLLTESDWALGRTYILPAALQQDEPWGAEVLESANLTTVDLAGLRASHYYDCVWTRYIIGRRGRYFVVMDDLRAATEGELMLTATWRTWAPTKLKGMDWVQEQDGVQFFIKPAFGVLSNAGQAPAEEYQGEIVPWLLRQTIPLSAAKPGDGDCFQNLLYASSPRKKQEYHVARLSSGCVLVQGTDELAVMGIAGNAPAPLQTDAGMFYVSPQVAAIAGGSRLSLGDLGLLRLSRKQNVEQTLTPAQGKVVKRELEQMWREATPRKAFAPLDYPRAELTTVKSFDGFRKRPALIQPKEVRVRKGLWESDLGKVEDISQVVVVGGNPETKLEFSDDRFQKDTRAADEGKPSTRIIGPIGKGGFRTQKLFTFPGAKARYARLNLPRKGSSEGVQLLSNKEEPAFIVELTACDLDADNKDGEILCRTRDNQLALLSEKGRLRWKRDFQHKLLTVATLDLDESGKRDLFVVDAGRTLWRFTGAGKLVEEVVLNIADEKCPKFARATHAYSLGAWRPTRNEKTYLMMGAYQSVRWRKPDGTIIWLPPEGHEHTNADPNRRFFVYRQLVYWERTLPRGTDFNSDGVEDQVLLSRGWTGIPTLLFFDGKRLGAMREYKFLNGRTLGLEVIDMGGERFVLAVNEFQATLCSLKAQELWTARFSTPVAGYDVDDGRIVLAQRDGMVVQLDRNGTTAKRQLLTPELRSVAVVGGTAFVAGSDGLFCLDENLENVRVADIHARIVTRIADTTLAAALEDGRVVLFER